MLIGWFHVRNTTRMFCLPEIHLEEQIAAREELSSANRIRSDLRKEDHQEELVSVWKKVHIEAICEAGFCRKADEHQQVPLVPVHSMIFDLC